MNHYNRFDIAHRLLYFVDKSQFTHNLIVKEHMSEIENSKLSVIRGVGLPELLSMNSMVKQFASSSQFFCPIGVSVSKHGIVGMLIVDAKPSQRCISYSESIWIGEMDNGHGHESNDPIQHAHFFNTEHGFSLIRVLVLPARVAALFSTDRFLGEAVITKCMEENVYADVMDEMVATQITAPLNRVSDLVSVIAHNAWTSIGMSEDPKKCVSMRARLSFHAWFAYSLAVDQGRLALAVSLNNFDGVLDKFSEKMSGDSGQKLIPNS